MAIWSKIIISYFCYFIVIWCNAWVYIEYGLTTQLCSVSEAADCFVRAQGLIQYFSTQREAAKCLWMVFVLVSSGQAAQARAILSRRNCRPSTPSYMILVWLIVGYHRPWQWQMAAFFCTDNMATSCVYYTCNIWSVICGRAATNFYFLLLSV